MEMGQPSRTAMAAAYHRAAHQVMEQGRIFKDPLALQILGIDATTIDQALESETSRRRMRIFIAARSRLADEALSLAVAHGVRQVVVLGAGLDTLAYRHTWPPETRVLEVDHPATQNWKRERLAESGISLPTSLTFAAIDFTQMSLSDGLASAGFDANAPAFFTWLGVLPYLPEHVILGVLEFIAGRPSGSQIIFDYANPPASLSLEARLAHERRAQRVAETGEPWVSYFETEDLHSRLAGLGFGDTEDFGPSQIANSYFPRTSNSPLSDKGGHILRASVSATR